MFEYPCRSVPWPPYKFTKNLLQINSKNSNLPPPLRNKFFYSISRAYRSHHSSPLRRAHISAEKQFAMENSAKIVKNAEKFVEKMMNGRDASHDAVHAFRVRDLALSLSKEENLDHHQLLIVELAALLHDIGDYKYTKDLIEDTTTVEKFLNEQGLEEGVMETILSIIKGMGFKNEVSRITAVSSLEFGVVQDADRLDAIGAIGIARCFTYGGSKNAPLHDPKVLPRQDLSKEKYMKKDEKQTTINHFHEKLFKLRGMMKTEAGRKRAERRHKFMQDFVDEFYEEWSGRA